MSGSAHGPSSDLVKSLLPARRKKEGLVLAEGDHLVAEALAGSWRVARILARKGEIDHPLVARATSRGIPASELDGPAMEKISELPAPPSIAVVVEARIPTLAELGSPARVLVLDGVQDPGNAGTLLRTARAFGFATYFLAGGASPANEKVIRASAGIAFHAGTLAQGGDAESCAAFLREKSYRVVALEPRAEQALPRVDATSPRLALVLGSEAHGIHATAWARAIRARIPMAEGVESLNVATSGAIALYQLSGFAR